MAIRLPKSQGGRDAANRKGAVTAATPVPSLILLPGHSRDRGKKESVSALKGAPGQITLGTILSASH